MFEKLFKMILNLFSVACYTAAQDKVVPPGKCNFDIGAHRVLAGLVGTTKFKNILGTMEFPFDYGNDSICGPKKITVIFCRTTPVGDTDYASLPTGSIAIQLTISATVVTDVDFWIKGGTGASDWRKILASSETTDATAYTSEKSLINVRGTNSGTGDFRAVYGRISLTHASAGSGEAVRGMGIANGGVNALRGAHLTAEIGTGGSVVGTAEGARIDFHTVADLTLSGGTVQCLNLVTNNASSVLGCTDSAHIRISDDSTYGMANIINFGTIVGRSTDADALGPYTFEDGGITIGATNAKVAFRVKTPDGTFYILGWADGEISAT
jgi:hypothetical protein